MICKIGNEMTTLAALTCKPATVVLRLSGSSRRIYRALHPAARIEIRGLSDKTNQVASAYGVVARIRENFTVQEH
jgi:peroxiredoxin